MRFRQTSIPVLLLIFILGSSALAAPPVALLRVNAGNASLDGKPINKAQMAAEGQKLELKAGAKVRVMLMGSRSELMVEGPTALVINKAQLSLKANKVKRGGVVVADDIGSLNAAAGLRTRSTKDTALNPELPPRKVDGEYLVLFDGDGKFQIDSRVDITIQALEPFESEYLYNKTFEDTELDRIKISPELKPGVRYEFAVQQERGSFYQQTFRLLTEQERVFLDEAGRELTKLSVEESRVQPLVQAASLCADLDQIPMALEYLTAAKNSRYPKSTELKKEIDKLHINYTIMTQMRIRTTKIQ